MDEAIIFCVRAVLKKYYDNVWHYGAPFVPKYSTYATFINRFLLGTGRMPHPVGGAMGVTLCHCRAARETRFDINIKYS